MSTRKYRTPSLRLLFWSRRMTDDEGMNALQGGPELFISDNCVNIEDVAPCDVDVVLVRAKATFFRQT